MWIVVSRRCGGWRVGKILSWDTPLYLALDGAELCADYVMDGYRMATNRVITIAIITVLVLLILAVIVSKFR